MATLATCAALGATPAATAAARALFVVAAEDEEEDPVPGLSDDGVEPVVCIALFLVIFLPDEGP